ncbi:MAG: hypothetical protein E7678_02170 [Ruminococcaceae bacterium]|nr:hypothetical protein [Oscillospiraceae bacterium]
MKPYTYIIYVSIFIFAICAITFTFRSANAYTFRKKVALPHGFSEGIMLGPQYTLLITDLALLLIQTALFLVYRTYSEPIIAIRVLCFLLSVLIYFILFLKTPPLFAYWFGQNGLWVTSSQGGKIPYSDIYNARLSKKIRLPIMNNQQLCKFSFYVKGKNSFFIPKKYVCKMTACEISALARQVDFSNNIDLPPQKSAYFARKSTPIFTLLICLVSIIQFVSCGILNTAKYTYSDTALTEEPITLSSPSELIISDDKLFLYYDSISVASVYTPDGEFLYALSLKPSGLTKRAFNVSGGCINYLCGDTVYIYSTDGSLTETVPYSTSENDIFVSKKPKNVVYQGRTYFLGNNGVGYTTDSANPVTVIAKDLICRILNPKAAWGINALLLVIVISLRLFAGEYKRILKAESEASQNYSDTNTETDIISEAEPAETVQHKSVQSHSRQESAAS